MNLTEKKKIKNKEGNSLSQPAPSLAVALPSEDDESGGDDRPRGNARLLGKRLHARHSDAIPTGTESCVRMKYVGKMFLALVVLGRGISR